MRIILALLVTVFIGSQTPVHINNSTTEQHHEEVVAVQTIVDQVEVANQTPTETIATVEPEKVVETVQEIPQEIVATENTCESEIAKYDWDQSTALAVMYAESTGNPNALNDNPDTEDYSVGCFQINLYGGNARVRPSELELYDPAINVAYAYGLYVSNGYSFIGQWGVCRDKVACY